jgi:hypothetical protein
MYSTSPQYYEPASPDFTLGPYVVAFGPLIIGLLLPYVVRWVVFGELPLSVDVFRPGELQDLPAAVAAALSPKGTRRRSE